MQYGVLGATVPAHLMTDVIFTSLGQTWEACLQKQVVWLPVQLSVRRAGCSAGRSPTCRRGLPSDWRSG